MMKTATQGYFLFNDVLYQQVDGVIMGSPLGPTMANFFLAVLEIEWLTKTCGERLTLYLRYVDDIFLLSFDKDLTLMNSLLKLMAHTLILDLLLKKSMKHSHSLILK